MVVLGYTYFVVETSACSPSLEWFKNPPSLETIIEGNPIVFIGAVISADGKPYYLPGMGMFTNAKFKIEMPIKGVGGDTIEIRQGQPSACLNKYLTGERWFFAGDIRGSSTLSAFALHSVFYQDRVKRLYELFPAAKRLSPTPPN